MTAPIAGSFFQLDYGNKLDREIASLLESISHIEFDTGKYPRRWLVIKLLEADTEILERVRAMPNGNEMIRLATQSADKLKSMLGDDVDMLVADRRYGFINGVVRQSLKRPSLDRITVTDRVDDIVTNKWVGLPIFFAMMYVVFRLVIDVAAPFTEWMDSVITGPIAHWAALLLGFAHAPAWINSLAVDAGIGGVGGVLVFVPSLMILYFFLAILEDSGYMSRAAFVMDRFMRVVGLHGKSFIPMILGFGCAVPAVYATRTIASRRDRVLTALLIPLMSCSARLPVYVVFGLAFFGAKAGTVIWGMYALGIVVAMLSGMIFTRTILKPDVSSAFVLELPPYRQPSLKSVLIHMWENTREFVHKAGTVILFASFVMWILLNLPWGIADKRDSYFGRISNLIAPIFAPVGFGDWQTSGALVTGFMAKELVVSSMSQIYYGDQSVTQQPPVSFPQEIKNIGVGFVDAVVQSGKTLLSIIPGVNLLDDQRTAQDTVLSRALKEHFTPLSALTLLVFVLLYVPCVATLGAIRQEFGSQWAIASAMYQTTVAWLAALIVFQAGHFWGLG